MVDSRRRVPRSCPATAGRHGSCNLWGRTIVFEAGGLRKELRRFPVGVNSRTIPGAVESPVESSHRREPLPVERRRFARDLEYERQAGEGLAAHDGAKALPSHSAFGPESVPVPAGTQVRRGVVAVNGPHPVHARPGVERGDQSVQHLLSGEVEPKPPQMGGVQDDADPVAGERFDEPREFIDRQSDLGALPGAVLECER